MPSHPSGAAARSRLDDAPDVYAIALAVADDLDRRGLDLWAAGVRSCLDAPGSTARQQHLAVELTRLAATGTVRREGLDRAIGEALGRLAAGLGDVDVVEQPLYAAVRDLAEHLELHGGRRWLTALRTVVDDPDRTAEARLRRLDAVLERMGPGAEGLPVGTADRVAAVRTRLPRHRDLDAAATYVGHALRPPAPSRRLPYPGARQAAADEVCGDEARAAEAGA